MRRLIMANISCLFSLIISTTISFLFYLNKTILIKMVKLKVAVCQCACQEFNFEKTLLHLEKYSREAACKGAQLALFPEGFIGGYPRFSHFGALVGCRSDQGRTEFVHYYQGAITIKYQNEKSSEIKKIEEIARHENIFLVIGIIEKDGGTLYCSVIYIHPLNGLVHNRRKLMPTGIERLIWGFGHVKDVQSVQLNKDISMSALIWLGKLHAFIKISCLFRQYSTLFSTNCRWKRYMDSNNATYCC